MRKKPLRTPSTRKLVLTPEREAELKENAAGILAEMKRTLLARHPFVGGISMQLDVTPTRDSRIPTACTTGSELFFDIGFLASLKPEEVLFVLAHEIWHCVLQHPQRNTGGMDHEIWNQAIDLEVNQMLLKDGLTMPADGLTPQNMHVPANLSAEQYYELLAKQKQSQSGSGGADKDSESQDGPTSGQFDQHLSEGQSVDDLPEPEQQMSDKYGNLGHDKDVNGAEVSERATERIRQAVLAAVQQMQQRGDVPAHLKGLVQEMLEPEVCWQELLSQFITRSAGAGRVNWSLPNKRLYGSGVYLPSKEADAVKLGVLLDTSGSCSEDLQKFLSEVNGIVKAFGNYSLDIVQCDAEVGKVDHFDLDHPLDLEHETFETTGGGGTRLLPGIQEFSKLEDPVDAIVAFTDGECENLGPEVTDLPILWVLCRQHDCPNLTVGEQIHFKA